MPVKQIATTSARSKIAALMDLFLSCLAFTLVLSTYGLAYASPSPASHLGELGVSALERGSYQEAANLFARVLNTKGLKRDDRELAYLKRGEARLALGDFEGGEKDLIAALRIHPDDAEAQHFLEIVRQAMPAPGTPPRAEAVSTRASAQAAWGAMARLAGHTWLEIDDKPLMYFQYQWEQPWKVLTFTGMDKNGNAFAGQYQLDEATSQISGMAVYKGQAGQSLVQTTADSWTDEGQSGKSQTRQTFQVTGPAAFQLSQTWLKNGKWYQGKPMQYVQTSPTVIASLGWTTAPPQPSFWAGMLSSMKAGALAGLQDGIHDGVHDRTQCGIAGKKTQAPGCTTGP